MNEKPLDTKASEATLKDIDIVFGIIKQCAVWMNGHQNNPDWLSYYTSPEVLRSKFEHGKVLLFYVDGEPVATVSLMSEAPGYYTENTDGENGRAVNYIEKFQVPESQNVLYRGALAVIPKFQGKGLGRKIIEMTEDLAKKEGIEFIRMDSRNIHLKDFYEKVGYKIVGEMPDGETVYYLWEKRI